MTLGLSMITNDAEATINVLSKYGKYFDKWFITVADKDKKQLKILDDWIASEPNQAMRENITSYFKWTDDFAAARNVNLKTIDTDYWFWMDSDDIIENPERLTELVKYMATNSVEVVQLKYDYAQNEQGQAISDHWRERVIKTDYEGQWHAPVHETFQGPPAIVEQLDWVTIKHDKDKIDVAGSMKRNERILRKHWAETKDPRDASYLGMTELAAGNTTQAIAWFQKHIETSGADEDKYRSWCRIAECEWMLQNFEQGLYATDEAIKLKPDFPDAYFIKVMIYTNMEEYDKGIEWLKVAASKPVPKTIHMIDPTLYKFRGLAFGAQCYLFGGRVKEAFRLYKEVMANDPSEDIFSKDMQQLFEDAYFDQKALDYTKWLLAYLHGNKADYMKLFQALPARLFADPRLNAERVKYIPKQTWPAKSIAIYCGPANETWGPDTLDKGMGGSEEAIVYLSRELKQLGWKVTVFNDREEEYVDNVIPQQELWLDGVQQTFAVTYKPWSLFNPNDTFDVFIAWRNPSFARAVGIKARIKAVDMHDVPGQIAKADVEANDLWFVKSKYHASLLPNVPKTKIKVIGNGIERSQF